MVARRIERALRRGMSAAAAALCVAALAPAAASAASFNFFNPEGLGPSGGAGTIGPATSFPSSTLVSGLSGSVTKVTVTLLRFGAGRPDDVDALLISPEGEQVVLMSDACGDGELQSTNNNFWTFDDDAPAKLPNEGPCASDQAASFKPSNYVGNSPEPDLFPAGGGIAPPYENQLAAFDGEDPNGPWDLYVNDDREGVVGFEISGWLLTLEVEPPAGPPAPPAGSPAPTPPATKAPTGKRARALAKCKGKPTKKARKRCRAKARKLPL